MTTNTGGPAFPADDYWANGEVHHGITLRDYFAAKAMMREWSVRIGMGEEREEVQIARKAYRMADAMLKEREK